jgi:hypothetical protein
VHKPDRRGQLLGRLLLTGALVQFSACGGSSDPETATITSADSATFAVGTPGAFTVTTTGSRSPHISVAGALPAGVTFDEATSILGGTPAASSEGTYPLTITVRGGLLSPAVTQAFTLTVGVGGLAPTITSPDHASFDAGGADAFTVTATGAPTPTLAVAGTLPSGVHFDPGAGVISGQPEATAGGVYPLIITASNGVSPDAAQSFTLTVVSAPPVITSASEDVVFDVGTPQSVTITATGTPTPTFSLAGGLPPGLSFDSRTGVLACPGAANGGTYHVTITASNGVSPDADQSFTLTVHAKSSALLVVHDGTAGTEADALANLTSIATSAGFTVTPSVGVPAGSLSAYSQVWDIRFSNTTPVSGADTTAYTTYLNDFGTVFLMGENAANFMTRDNSIKAFLEGLGSGTIAFTTPANAEEVLFPFDSPNAVSSITFLAANGTSNPGTGEFITRDVNGVGAAIVYETGSLSGAPTGMVYVVFDVNFLLTGADVASHRLTANMAGVP